MPTQEITEHDLIQKRRREVGAANIGHTSPMLASTEIGWVRPLEDLREFILGIVNERERKYEARFTSIDNSLRDATQGTKEALETATANTKEALATATA